MDIHDDLLISQDDATVVNPQWVERVVKSPHVIDGKDGFKVVAYLRGNSPQPPRGIVLLETRDSSTADDVFYKASRIVSGKER